MSQDIFISYRRSDEHHARVLHDLLKTRGVDAWYDAELPAGEDWRTATANALVKAPIFVLLFSRNAASSDDIAKELAAATFQKKLVIPVRIEPIQPEGAFLYELAARNWFDAFEDTDARLAILADQLAELLRSGPTPQTMGLNLGATGVNPTGAPGARGFFTRPHVLFLAGLAVAAFIALAVMNIWGTRPAQAPQASKQSQRIAFFGVSTEGENPIASFIANAATDQMFQTMGALRLDVAARTETLGTGTAQRFARATELGALYALSGDLRIEKTTATLSIRFEDIPSRTMLWEQSFTSAVAETGSLPVQAAIRTNQTLRCVIDWVRPKLTTDNATTLKLVADACRSGGYTDYSDDFLVRTRALANAEPKSGFFQTLLAAAIIFSAETAPLAARPARMAEAEALIKRAENLDPQNPWLILSRLALILAKPTPLKELETSLRDALTTLEGKDAFAYSQVNMMYGSLASSAGRWSDAVDYWNVATSTDPLQNTFYLAYLFAIKGKASQAQDLFEREFARYPSADIWGAWVSTAIFLGVGDADAMLMAPPTSIPRPAVECWRSIRKAYLSRNRKVRLAGSNKALECNTVGVIGNNEALISFVALGNLDLAFAMAEAQGAPTEALFWPTTSEMRADKRFLPLVEQLGLMDYWKASKTRPESCDTETAPFCRALQ